MMGNGREEVIQRSTAIRKLPPGAIRRIAEMLNVSGEWRTVAERIVHRNGGPKFDWQQIKVFAMSPNPAESVLISWSNDNAKVGQLVDLLAKAGLYRPADYLAVSVMKGQPVPRRPEDASMTVCPFSDGGGVNSTSLPLSATGRENCKVRQEGNGDDRDREGHALPPRTEHVDPTLIDDVIGGIRKQEFFEDEAASHQEGKDEAASHKKGEDEGKSKQYTAFELKAMTDNFNLQPKSQGGRLLGCGGFGEVFLGKSGRKLLAVKKLKVEVVTNETIEQFHNEVRVLSTVCHRNLLELDGYSIDSWAVCVVYPFMCNGSLEDRLARVDGTPALPAGVRVRIAKGIASGINHLHTKRLIHRDIKSANVLLDENMTAKVGDCGLVHSGPSSADQSATLTKKIIGTTAYMAPEYVLCMEVSSKLDSYSYGIVLLELLTGLQAFDANREERDLKTHMRENCDDVMEMIDSSAGQWAENVVKDMYNTAWDCLIDVRKRRPEIAQILDRIKEWSES